MADIAIRLVQATLLEFLHHHRALHLKALLAECQFQHTVGLQPKADFHIRLGNRQVVIGNIIVCPCVVFTTCLLQRSVIIGNMHRTAEHQMLEQMGKARMLGMFVTGTHVINNIQGNHLCAGVLIVHQPQAVGKAILIYFHVISNKELKELEVPFSPIIPSPLLS